MSDYEINCAVKDKLKLPSHRGNGNLTYKDGKSILETFDYCNDPAAYMPIAIEHGISIKFCTITNTVTCSFLSMELTKERLTRPKHETGRAVCECFLLMDITL